MMNFPHQFQLTWPIGQHHHHQQQLNKNLVKLIPEMQNLLMGDQ